MVEEGEESSFGYKLFTVVDEHGFVRHLDTTPANQSEVTYFEEVVKAMPQQATSSVADIPHPVFPVFRFKLNRLN